MVHRFNLPSTNGNSIIKAIIAVSFTLISLITCRSMLLFKRDCGCSDRWSLENGKKDYSRSKEYKLIPEQL
ncbi:hypothetical protein HanRHA438_Chr05g0233901 [Helianthus annuus]|uniref:Uncharacterized protein n=1 Tax=Helianthus annuus TaxID=4232 RepID=A0A251URW5_HELAN|nr:hypothetical protein HanXRQr2_Chr05g0224891 [Helianthus annuus]KAJ0585300.1 hypothetical protein HanHA89_Chr05g0198791 [Helianthus annuus]KAJ0919807.1 hypothetical protein HanRHA438_Chr05g0233901 [Helianthus annuus]KAJ0923528.1 hypothetical protein HanPSC8_Chr05g0217021 [Helianthus annuus]